VLKRTLYSKAGVYVRIIGSGRSVLGQTTNMRGTAMTTSQHRPTAGSRFGFTLGPARSLALGLLAGALVLPMTARAGEGGDGSRQVAGGGHMSSYVNDPHHDPRSLHSQRLGTGQLLGAPMMHDRAGPAIARRSLVDPHWASGTTQRRRIAR
jgi:hypothetical protein